MDHQHHQSAHIGAQHSQQESKNKKPVTFKSLLDSKKIDKKKVKEYFLENYINLPQEFRLLLWKIFLGITSSNLFENQFGSTEKIFSDHYIYLKHNLENVLDIKMKKADELNYCIYLLDRDYLPLNRDEILVKSQMFCLLYKQLCDVIDDQSEYEAYYLTAELYEYLKANLDSMKLKFNEILNSNENFTENKSIFTSINIEPFLLSGLAGLFTKIELYHIIWDGLIMSKNEMLIATLASLLEQMKEDHLNAIKSMSKYDVNFIRKFLVDETKIFKKATKYYKHFYPNSNISNLIANNFVLS